jgi:hypothetical protein
LNGFFIRPKIAKSAAKNREVNPHFEQIDRLAASAIVQNPREELEPSVAPERSRGTPARPAPELRTCHRPPSAAMSPGGRPRGTAPDSRSLSQPRGALKLKHADRSQYRGHDGSLNTGNPSEQRSGGLAPLVTMVQPTHTDTCHYLRCGWRARCNCPAERGVLAQPEMGAILVKVCDVAAVVVVEG